MTVTGIIAEFNPFHNGHKYLLEQAEGVKIVAMSGNFVQRGEPAIVDKWTRAQMALENGADLVVELPFLVAVQSADHFAKGAVEILSRLGIDQLTFGTEEVIDYQAIATVYSEKSSEMEAFLRSLPEDLSYPQKTQKCGKPLLEWSSQGYSQPYSRAGLCQGLCWKGDCTQAYSTPGSRLPFRRKEGDYASATSLRLHKEDQDFVAKFMPNSQLFQSAPQVSWENYDQLLRYQILTHPDLTQIFQVNEELANRIKDAVRSANSVEDLVEKVATKRYTKARVRRILTYILVGVMDQALPDAIHVLGFSAKGQTHLKGLKNQ